MQIMNCIESMEYGVFWGRATFDTMEAWRVCFLEWWKSWRGILCSDQTVWIDSTSISNSTLTTSKFDLSVMVS